jgi:thioredoxin-dependent peroxiredoxin
MAELQVGDVAPAFEAQTQSGKTVKLSDLKGKTVVLYFYPKDDTPGCTKEACSFRDHIGALQAKDVVVLGVSADDVTSHQKFAQKFSLPFDLLADTDKRIIQAYGAWGEKTNYGKSYMGIIRSTVVIGPDGKVKEIIKKVNTETHATDILATL